MSRATAILAALHALVANAVPGAAVSGFTGDASMPERIGAGGAIIGSPGDPGTAEFDLSPVAYTFSHTIPVEACLPALAGGAAQADAALAALIAPIGAAVQANRQLGGLVSWLDVTAATFTSDGAVGAVPLRVASFDFTAEYTVSNPLAE